MTDSVFLLRCVDCDALGRLSRLWLRTSIRIASSSSSSHNSELLHYVECMNCGARLKSRHRDFMENVDDDEWSRFVGDEFESESNLPSGMERID